MTCTLRVAWDDRLAGYDFGPGHPMAPLRLTMELARAATACRPRSGTTRGF
jgi:acetoin utilization protein AcuC